MLGCVVPWFGAYVSSFLALSFFLFGAWWRCSDPRLGSVLTVRGSQQGGMDSIPEAWRQKTTNYAALESAVDVLMRQTPPAPASDV